MKVNQTMIIITSLMLVLAALPLFAQKGIGAGLGLGTQAHVGAGTGVQAGGANVGVHPAADIQAKTSAQTNATAAHSEGKSGAVAGANIASRIDGNPQLSARVQSLLPAGESISAASAGFKNEGQFIAALHVSHNLNIPFDQLKAKMTGSNAMSLSAAIHTLKPDMKESEAKEEAKKADVEGKTTASTKVATSASTKE